MKSLDVNNKNKIEIKNDMVKALKENDDDKFVEAQVKLAEIVQAELIQEANLTSNIDTTNENIMLSRGLNPLTSEEKKYYNEVIEAEGFKDIDVVMPTTIFERVFEDLRANRPLLARINFVNTTGITEWITRDGEVKNAWWGKLCEETKKKLETGFKKERTNLYKVSAYFPVCKAMLHLGPEWLDRYVREYLYESLAGALETGIIMGDGDEEPIGMDRDLKGAVREGKYPAKELVLLKSLNAKHLGKEVMAPLTDKGARMVTDVLLIVNPVDYWSKVFGALAVRDSMGNYILDQTAIGATIIQSVAIEEGKMIAGMAKDYFMGTGLDEIVDYSDHYRFLEDERTYLGKMYANGRPKDNKSFITYDISELGEGEGTDNPEIPEA